MKMITCPRCNMTLRSNRDMCSCGWRPQTMIVQKSYDPWKSLSIEAQEALYVREMCSRFGKRFERHYAEAKEKYKNCRTGADYLDILLNRKKERNL